LFLKIIHDCNSIGVVILVIIATLFFVIPQNQDCLGDAKCIKGQVTQVVDGDTIKVEGQSIRFALSSSPEMYDEKGVAAKSICLVFFTRNV
jgi:endonuclease YncB( thermonuclease family)